MKKVLLVTSLREDYYYRPFLAACKNKAGLEVFVFDTSRFPSEAQFCVTMDATGVLEGWINVLNMNPEDGSVDQVTLSITEIKTAWFLRAPPPEPKWMNSRPDVLFSTSESSGALNALWRVVPWNWINRKDRVKEIQHNKLWQQQLAARIGLRVPYTMVSNDPVRVASFAGSQGGLLCKTFGYVELGTKADLFVYSNLFSATEIRESVPAIANCPIFAQEYVPKRYEYRVMVIGNGVLACRIDSQASTKTRIDWRHYDFDNVTHTPCKLPDSVSEHLLLFMREAELHYGAIDLIETPAGDFVFLEVNPSGQWGWIAHYAGLPIPEAVATMLCDV